MSAGWAGSQPSCLRVRALEAGTSIDANSANRPKWSCASAGAKAVTGRSRCRPMAKIKELGEMRSQGLLTDEEFGAEKARILAT